MPSKSSPTSLGSATLEPGKGDAMNQEELGSFLSKHELGHLRNKKGIEWRAKKLEFALTNNSKLINPKLDKQQKV